MTHAQLKSRVAELEAEVARLNARVEELTPRRDWWNRIGRERSTPESIKAYEDQTRIMRQLRDSDRELDPTPQLTRLRLRHRALIRSLRKLAGFKSNLAAAEYAHREFTH